MSAREVVEIIRPGVGDEVVVREKILADGGYRMTYGKVLDAQDCGNIIIKLDQGDLTSSNLDNLEVVRQNGEREAYDQPFIGDTVLFLWASGKIGFGKINEIFYPNDPKSDTGSRGAVYEIKIDEGDRLISKEQEEFVVVLSCLSSLNS